MQTACARIARTAHGSPAARVAEAMQVRCVHSKRQIKRKEKHPIMHRRRKLAAKENPTPAPTLRFEGTYTPPQVSFNGWSPAPAEPVVVLISLEVCSAERGKLMQGLRAEAAWQPTVEVRVDQRMTPVGVADCTVMRTMQEQMEVPQMELPPMEVPTQTGLVTELLTELLTEMEMVETPMEVAV